MLTRNEIMQTLDMIDQQHLDIRTITMGISLLSCCHPDPEEACRRIYDKICRHAERLVATGEQIELEFGIPIVNKRISVTPMALVAAASETADYVPFARADVYKRQDVQGADPLGCVDLVTAEGEQIHPQLGGGEG